MTDVRIRTRFYPRTPKRPYGRIVAAVTDGPDQGRKETFRWDGAGAHQRAAQRLVRLLGIEGVAVEVESRDTGSTFEISRT